MVLMVWIVDLCSRCWIVGVGCGFCCVIDFGLVFSVVWWFGVLGLNFGWLFDYALILVLGWDVCWMYSLVVLDGFLSRGFGFCCFVFWFAWMVGLMVWALMVISLVLNDCVVCWIVGLTETLDGWTGNSGDLGDLS